MLYVYFRYDWDLYLVHLESEKTWCRHFINHLRLLWLGCQTPPTSLTIVLNHEGKGPVSTPGYSGGATIEAPAQHKDDSLHTSSAPVEPETTD